ncbi:MerR family transcriptional regulator, mercuric resistance operon regulatory protein [Sulfurivirga caldicuralii]|uniref:Mercuric resistance operon regulatory protein n=1 Tax=Sulfurivirga caldicuralii TaxID=364032 RepID=A0A1N6DNM2_9GAMM|nr:MerR family transcriptional regulator [Sulfurivirga caldicuralii]SIN72336.1 MerR family transcriptional regulator, mercuric resistance operon regulatory protein [Sulfurivirga caldicuralii]
MRIRELAKAAGVNVETVRYYQRRGLIDTPPKPLHGYRCYAPETLQRLRFIRQAQQFGFTLKEIEALLAISDAPCGEVRAQIEAKLEKVRARMAALQRLEAALVQQLDHCRQQSNQARCPLIEALLHTDEFSAN